ncbi:hypothetical protein CVT24_011245 [Panaeolus cyanescens]|uniref:Uncharacterized protein n=1 Tax=Panaeolus cyanescens TaxID=181874 RepID=A0A409YGG7_9AGAR|nr:hypothetical protein CVT24_011245 [Panaeolus cyanescens]
MVDTHLFQPLSTLHHILPPNSFPSTFPQIYPFVYAKLTVSYLSLAYVLIMLQATLPLASRPISYLEQYFIVTSFSSYSFLCYLLPVN